MAMDQAEIVTAESIFSEFQDLEDPRSQIILVDLPGGIIVLSIMAVIAGAGGPNAVGAVDSG